MAIITSKHPERIQDFLEYQSLILEAHLEYAGDSWLAYDRRFRLMAAANRNTTWATVNTTLWNLAFTGKAKSSRCRYCFSITHSSANCDWALDLLNKSPTVQRRPRPFICYKWNNVPGHCPVYTCFASTTLQSWTKLTKQYIALSTIQDSLANK